MKTQGSEPALVDATAAGGVVAAAGRGGQLVLRDDGGWRDVIAGDGRAFASATVAADGVVSAVGSSGLFVQRGLDGGWTYPNGYPGPDSSIAGIEAVAVTDAGLFVASDYNLKRRTPQGTWVSEANSTTGFISLWAVGNELWAATPGGNIVHRDPASHMWPPELVSSNSLKALWGSAPDSLFAVGNAGVVLARTDGGSWIIEQVMPTADLIAVTGTAGVGVWALAGDGGIYQRRQDGWSPVVVPSSVCTSRNALAAAGGDLWFGGADQLCVLRANASDPDIFRLPTTNDVSSLLVAQDTLYIFGNAGTVLHKALR
jgi:hypothetical protein